MKRVAALMYSSFWQGWELKRVQLLLKNNVRCSLWSHLFACDEGEMSNALLSLIKFCQRAAMQCATVVAQGLFPHLWVFVELYECDRGCYWQSASEPDKAHIGKQRWANKNRKITSVSIVPVCPTACRWAGWRVEVRSCWAGVHVLLHVDGFGPFAVGHGEV